MSLRSFGRRVGQLLTRFSWGDSQEPTSQIERRAEPRSSGDRGGPRVLLTSKAQLGPLLKNAGDGSLTPADIMESTIQLDRGSAALMIARPLLEKSVRRLDRHLSGKKMSDEESSEVEGQVRNCLSTFERELGTDSRETMVAIQALAQVRYIQNQFQDAARLFERLSASQRRELGSDHPALASTQCYLAWSYYFTDREKQAAKLVQQALRTLQGRKGEREAKLIFALKDLEGLLR